MIYFYLDFRLSLDEIHDLMNEEESDEQTEVRIAIEPPKEAPEVDTDQDSNGSDDEVTCNPVYLPRRILLSNVLSRNTDDDHPHIESTQSLASEPPKTKRQKKAAYKWHDNILQVVNLVPNYDEVSTVQCVQAAENNDEVPQGSVVRQRRQIL